MNLIKYTKFDIFRAVLCYCDTLKGGFLYGKGYNTENANAVH